MAFITMPAPKVGTMFYDKPGNARKLHKLKRLQDKPCRSASWPNAWAR